MTYTLTLQPCPPARVGISGLQPETGKNYRFWPSQKTGQTTPKQGRNWVLPVLGVVFVHLFCAGGGANPMLIFPLFFRFRAGSPTSNCTLCCVCRGKSGRKKGYYEKVFHWRNL